MNTEQLLASMIHSAAFGHSDVHVRVIGLAHTNEHDVAVCMMSMAAWKRVEPLLLAEFKDDARIVERG